MKTGDQVTAKTLEPEGDTPRNLKGTLEIRTFPASDYYPAFTAHFVNGQEADPATIKVTDKKPVEVLSGERFLDHLRTKALVAHGSHDQKTHGNWAKGNTATVALADNPQDKFFFPGVSVKNEVRLRDTIDSIAKVHGLPANLPKSSVEVRQTGMGTADGIYHPDKKTIYMADGSDIMRFGFVHEFGHHLTMVDGGLVYPENSGNTLETKGPGRWRMEVMGSGVGKKASDLAPVIEAIEKTQAYKAIQERALRAIKAGDSSTPEDNFAVYLGDPRELFARSYAQWIATRSNDQQLFDEFSRFRSRTDAHDMQWRDTDFAIVAEALEDYFRGRSLTASATQFHSCDTHDCKDHGNWADLTQVTTLGLDRWPAPLRDKIVERASNLQQRWGVKVTLDGRPSGTRTNAEGKTEVDVYNLAEEYEALAAVPPADTTIYLNPQLVIDSWRTQQMKTAQQVALARTLADVITHEYGHALQGELERRLKTGDDPSAFAALTELKRPFLAALDVDEPGEEWDDLAQNVSFYATETVDEAIAEAFLQNEKSGGKEKFQSSWSQHVTEVFNSQFRKEES